MRHGAHPPLAEKHPPTIHQVEEQKRRAEADKLAAITALEQRSREFLREKEEKKQLEAKISAMQSQLLIGGQKLEDTVAFRYVYIGDNLL